MDFLTAKNIYHGDLAARNVLLTDSLDTKISDFGLSRRLYSDSAHSLKVRNEKFSLPLPIKWIAIELLTRHEFIPIKSDVWSFGRILHMSPQRCQPVARVLLQIDNYFKSPLFFVNDEKDSSSHQI